MKQRNISVEVLDQKPVVEQRVELVERKGIGHPDSICDGIAENVSRALSREYLARFGTIMHHNTDQVELVGGRNEVKWGGGRMMKPIYILLGGRATSKVDGTLVPTGEIAIEAARNYLKENIKELDANNHVIIDQKIGEGSSDLQNVFKRKGTPKSNDTSFGCGFAPFSLTEQLTLEVAEYINGDLKIKASGTDVKVMGVRCDDKITLTIANAFIDKYLKDVDAYVEAKTSMREKILDFIATKTDKDVEVDINTADDIESGSVFLTVTGTSAEHGDDGSVGRGNRANGLITPYRPMSMEATAGKNTVNHVGKIYNILSNKIANEIAEKTGCTQVYVRLMSQIGKPIDQPLIASIQIIGDKKAEKEAQRITDYWLENVTQVTDWCVKGKTRTF
ncbi:S-adenosylmethionine synthase [uncultured archaeon]|nr:S-adenosylmethionine synthase [uncultured archaeon]